MWTEREGQLTAERSILTDINRAEIFVVRITRVGCCIVAAVTRLQTSELFMAPEETVPGSSGLHVTKMLSQIEIRSCHLRGLCRKSGTRTHIRTNWCYPVFHAHPAPSAEAHLTNDEISTIECQPRACRCSLASLLHFSIMGNSSHYNNILILLERNCFEKQWLLSHKGKYFG